MATESAIASPAADVPKVKKVKKESKSPKDGKKKRKASVAEESNVSAEVRAGSYSLTCCDDTRGSDGSGLRAYMAVVQAYRKSSAHPRCMHACVHATESMSCSCLLQLVALSPTVHGPNKLAAYAIDDVFSKLQCLAV